MTIILIIIMMISIVIIKIIISLSFCRAYSQDKASLGFGENLISMKQGEDCRVCISIKRPVDVQRMTEDRNEWKLFRGRGMGTGGPPNEAIKCHQSRKERFYLQRN